MSGLKLTPKVNLHDPIYHDDDAARAHLESDPLAARADLPALRRYG